MSLIKEYNKSLYMTKGTNFFADSKKKVGTKIFAMNFLERIYQAKKENIFKNLHRKWKFNKLAWMITK